ncbi:MAG: glycosyltransferase family 39 protein [Spirochaetia bacterium]|nr:glycosyltransferase family 39 protein [Spirochaetia bacterium]
MTKRTAVKVLLLIAAILVFRSVIFPAISWKADEFFYLTGAREINAGRVLYTDFADVKPVGIFYIYALADRLAGHDLQMDFLVLRVFSVAAVLLISLMLWCLGKMLYNERAGYFAALLFAVYSTCVRGSEVLAANTELFSVLFMMASICFFCRGRFHFGYRDLIPAALFLSLSFLVNSRCGIVVLAYVVCLFLFSENKMCAFLKTLASAVAFLLPIGLIVLYYWQIGHLDDYLNWQFVFTKYYAGAYSFFMRIFRGILIYRFFAGLLPLLFFVGYLFLGASSSKEGGRFNHAGLFLLILLAALWLSAFSGGKHVERYYFQMFIPLVMLAGAGLDAFLAAHDSVAAKWLLAFMLLSSPVIYLHMNLLSIWLDKKPMTYQAFMDERQPAVDYIQKNSSPEDAILIWPFGDIFYCASDRKLATPIYDPSGHLLGGKYLNTKERVDQFYGMFFDKLEKSRPVVIVDSTPFFGTEGSDINEYMIPYLEELRDYVRTNYDKVDIDSKYNVYKRKNGK